MYCQCGFNLFTIQVARLVIVLTWDEPTPTIPYWILLMHSTEQYSIKVVGRTDSWACMHSESCLLRIQTWTLSTDDLKRALQKKEAQDALNALIPSVTLATSHKKKPCSTNYKYLASALAAWQQQHLESRASDWRVSLLPTRSGRVIMQVACRGITPA
jgi:hypothetical protein